MLGAIVIPQNPTKSEGVVYCFGPYEADVYRNELRKLGHRLKLERKPWQLLLAMLERPGEVVPRGDIQGLLWPDGLHVDFEKGLGVAMTKLRAALDDPAERPAYIETITGTGYRFLAQVTRVTGTGHKNGTKPEQVEIESISEPNRSEATLHGRLRWVWTAAFVVGVLATAMLVSWRRFHPVKPTLNFAARDWVLISNFENRTGDPVIDGTLEYALERELSNSQFVNVVPRERASDALRLMRKPPNMRIDAALGREICLRDGGIRALLTGRIEKLGTTYVLSTQLVDPANGVAVASLSEEEPDDSQMAASVRRLSDRVRETLGEKAAQIQQSEKQLEKVTTPSLHALRLYTQAEELMHREGAQAAAAELLKQALVEDPNFASAHLLLGYTFANQGKDAEAKPEFQRAFDLSGSAPDRERFFILGSYYESVEKNVPKAVEAYKALLQLYPDHYWAANNLAEIYFGDGRWDDSRRLSVHLADLRPDDAHRNRVAACGKFLSKDPNGARPYLDRATSLAAADPNPSPDDDFVELAPAFLSWSEGNVVQAHHQLQENGRGLTLPSAGFYWAFGEFAEAEKYIQKQPDDHNRAIFTGITEYLKGNLPAARKSFALADRERDQGCVGCTGIVVEVRLGLWNHVEPIIRKSPADSPGAEIVRGERALALGKTKTGIALLEKGIEAMHSMPVPALYMGSETLAQTYEKQGNLEAALRVLQHASDAKGRTFNCLSSGPMSGAWWLRTELQRADLYREMGRVPEAEKVEDELRKMLIYADADHPIVLALKKRESLSARLSPQPTGK